MAHQKNQQSISKLLPVVVMSVCSVLFLLIGFYLILVRDPQTNSRWQTENALSHISHAANKKNSRIAKAHIMAAHNSVVQALSASPHDPYLWIRLARIEKLLDHGNTDTVNDAVQIAIQLKPSLRAQIIREGFLLDE